MAYMRTNLLNVVLIYSKCVSAPLQSFRYSTVTALPASCTLTVQKAEKVGVQ